MKIFKFTEMTKQFPSTVLRKERNTAVFLGGGCILSISLVIREAVQNRGYEFGIKILVFSGTYLLLHILGAYGILKVLTGIGMCLLGMLSLSAGSRASSLLPPAFLLVSVLYVLTANSKEKTRSHASFLRLCAAGAAIIPVSYAYQMIPLIQRVYGPTARDSVAGMLPLFACACLFVLGLELPPGRWIGIIAIIGTLLGLGLGV